jgi:hypothetical protein
VSFGSFRRFARGLRPHGFACRLRFGRGRGGCRGWLVVKQQVFGRNRRVGGWLRAQIDAEQVFGQGFPGVFFAARAGAQRIGVHRGFVTFVKRTRGKSRRRRSIADHRDRKALAGK